MPGQGRRDDELVQLTRAGERAAFDALFGRYMAMIRGEAARHGLQAAAGDVVQETFLRAYLHLGELHDPARFASWLRAIAHRVCLTELRERVQMESVTAELAARARPTSTDHHAMRQLLAQLPPADREPLHLHHILGLDTAAAAAAMGIRPSTFRVRLHRARRRARALLASQRTEEMILMTGGNGKELAQRLVAEAEDAVGHVPMRAEDWPLFRRKLEEALRADPACLPAAWLLGRKLCKDGEYREAIKLLQGLWEKEGRRDGWVALTIAWSYDYLGDRHEALQWYARTALMPFLSETQRVAASAGIEEPQLPKAKPKVPGGLVEVPRKGWSANASHEQSSPNFAIDGNLQTRWSPMGPGQEPGMWFRLDLGKELPGLAGVWLDDDAGGQSLYQNDTCRHCVVSVSRDGEWWKKVAEWRWQPNHSMEAWWEPVAARYLMLEQRAYCSPEWWGIFEVHPYRAE